MSIKNAIAIGKGLGHLVKVEDNSGVEATFRSFLRLLVTIDVSKPLNPGFCFTRNDGSSTWISLKYERLDIYCTNYGKIGHKQISWLAQQVDRFSSRYLISLEVNVFSNMLSSHLGQIYQKITQLHLHPSEKIPLCHSWKALNPMQTRQISSQVPKIP
jgi:hypothetical protein